MRPLGEVVAALEVGRLDGPTGALQAGWVQLLKRYRFEWFVTFTFRDEVHPENADKAFRVWIRLLNEFLHGRRASASTAKQVFWVRALEWQKRGVIHFHALIGDTQPIADRIAFGTDKADKSCLLFWCERWFSMAGICRIEAIKSDDAVYEYVSKYIAKDGEIDVSANLKDYVPPQPGFLRR